MTLVGRVAALSGGAGGIGLACARALVDRGATVVVGDVSPERLAAAAAEVGCETMVCDVTRPGQAHALIETTVARHGRLDAVVTAAGVFDAASIVDVEADAFERVLAVNLTGVFHVAQAAVRAMIAGGRGGRIVTIGSLSSQTGGLVAGAAYTASKGGVLSLTRSIARFGGPHGVTANCVLPGIIDTEMTRGWSAEARAGAVDATPLGRLGTAAEVAELVAFLVSDGSAFVTGAHMDVNGGLFMA